MYHIITGLDRPCGFKECEAPRFQNNRHMKAVRLSALRTGRLYSPGNIPGTHFCKRQGHPQDHRIMSIKNSNGIIGRVEPATFRLVAQYLHHRVPHHVMKTYESDCPGRGLGVKVCERHSPAALLRGKIHQQQ